VRIAGDVQNGHAELALLSSGEVHVWLIRSGGTSSSPAWDGLCDVLSEAEREQLERRLRASDRELYLAAHGLLRVVLGHYLGLAPAAVLLGAGEHGKPYLESGPALELSLTHSAGVAAVALSALGPVGVDVESPARRCQPGEIAERYFTARETAAILAVPEARRGRRFFLYWTVKEAVLKAAGTGLTAPLHSVECALAGRTRWSVTTGPQLGPRGAGWRVAALALGGRHLVAVTVASARPAAVLRCRTLAVGDESRPTLRVLGCDPLSRGATRLDVAGVAHLVP
jgi:4'-phosphopantetheinyl transferase